MPPKYYTCVAKLAHRARTKSAGSRACKGAKRRRLAKRKHFSDFYNDAFPDTFPYSILQVKPFGIMAKKIVSCCSNINSSYICSKNQWAELSVTVLLATISHAVYPTASNNNDSSVNHQLKLIGTISSVAIFLALQPVTLQRNRFSTHALPNHFTTLLTSGSELIAVTFVENGHCSPNMLAHLDLRPVTAVLRKQHNVFHTRKPCAASTPPKSYCLHLTTEPFVAPLFHTY